jgi:cold shock CspA family protein
VRGVVEGFDDHRGIGAVVTDDGRRFMFHCTAIGDGTRTIAVGAEVDFQVVPAHHGRYEASSLALTSET